MGQTMHKESLTTEQLQEVVGELRTMDATVAIIVTASHHGEYVETTEDGQDHARSSYKWAPWSGGGPPSGAVCGGEDQGGPVYVARAHHQGASPLASSMPSTRGPTSSGAARSTRSQGARCWWGVA